MRTDGLEFVPPDAAFRAASRYSKGSGADVSSELKGAQENDNEIPWRTEQSRRKGCVFSGE